MFFMMLFKKDMIVTPSDLSKNLEKIIKVKLMEQVTGTCNLKYGYFIKVVNINLSNDGLIMEGTGDILFKVEYTAIVMRPLKGEICEGIIDEILNEGGCFVKVGPMRVHIPKDEMNPKFTLDKMSQCYVNEEDNTEMKIGTKVRFRYKDIQLHNNEFKPSGTMKEKYLGPLRNY